MFFENNDDFSVILVCSPRDVDAMHKLLIKFARSRRPKVDASGDLVGKSRPVCTFRTVQSRHENYKASGIFVSGRLPENFVDRLTRYLWMFLVNNQEALEVPELVTIVGRRAPYRLANAEGAPYPKVQIPDDI